MKCAAHRSLPGIPCCLRPHRPCRTAKLYCMTAWVPAPGFSAFMFLKWRLVRPAGRKMATEGNHQGNHCSIKYSAYCTVTWKDHIGRDSRGAGRSRRKQLQTDPHHFRKSSRSPFVLKEPSRSKRVMERNSEFMVSFHSSFTDLKQLRENFQ